MTVSVRSWDNVNIGAMGVGEFVGKVKGEIEGREFEFKVAK